MAKRRLTDKQKQKLRDSEFARSNSSDLTINPSYGDSLEYDDGNLSYDGRTKTGKKINRLLKSRNRNSAKTSDDDVYDSDDDDNNDDYSYDDGDYSDDDYDDIDEGYDDYYDDELDGEQVYNDENYEYIRENVIIDDNDEEVAVCPNCKATLTEYFAGDERDEFKCRNCGTEFTAELNNEYCEKCGRPVSEQRVINCDGVLFCCKACEYDYFDSWPDGSDEEENTPNIPSDRITNCTHCDSSGICRNDENRYFYETKCPGECDYYLH